MNVFFKINSPITCLFKRVAVMMLMFIPVLVNGQIYVSPEGDDDHPGTRDRPVATFAGAQEHARKADRSKPLEVIFLPGTYYLQAPVVFNAADSRPVQAPVIYRAEQPGTVVISGGSRLSPHFKPFKNGIQVSTLTGDPQVDQVYINGKRQRMARYPNAVDGKNVFDRWNLAKEEGWNNKSEEEQEEVDALDPSRIRRWAHPEGGFIHAMHAYLWGDMHWRITGKASDSTLAYEGGWQNNRPSEMHGKFRIVENIFEELDAPGEWYYQASTHELFYLPPKEIDLNTATVEIVRLNNLISFEGSQANPVTFVNLDGFIFRHTARTFMDNREPLGRSDWTLYRGGSVVYQGAEDCALTNCEFDQVGGNTILVNAYNRGIRISGCHIHESGASGVVFAGDPRAVRSYLVGYVKREYSALDTIPGPASDQYPSDCLVEDCLIEKTGRDEKQTAGIQISVSKNTRISHCSIYDMPRAGINISEGAFGGHVISDCDVFNTVLETSDHGSFNSWGRDRYWTPDVVETARQVANRLSMPFWDAADPVVIRNSRWLCEFGWDIDLDDGSSNYQIYNNLLLNRGLKLREGYHRTVTNNILVNNGLHPHVWYPESGDVFTHNIVFREYQPAVMSQAIAPDGRWGQELDYNFYVAPEDVMRKFSRNGCDLHSVNGDPMFIDARAGDFRVREHSPALAVGFVNFPMDRFGVTSPRLKTIAKSPPIPLVITQFSGIGTSGQKKNYGWLGATLHTPVGAELSAFGVSFEDGGVAFIGVPEGSGAASLGFRKGDLIREINGVKITSVGALTSYLGSLSPGAWLNISLVRNQAGMEMKIRHTGEQIRELDD
jgi:hypothetical protein